jgi:hypothetical protein
MKADLPLEIHLFTEKAMVHSLKRLDDIILGSCYASLQA